MPYAGCNSFEHSKFSAYVTASKIKLKFVSLIKALLIFSFNFNFRFLSAL